MPQAIKSVKAEVLHGPCEAPSHYVTLESQPWSQFCNRCGNANPYYNPNAAAESRTRAHPGPDDDVVSISSSEPLPTPEPDSVAPTGPDDPPPSSQPESHEHTPVYDQNNVRGVGKAARTKNIERQRLMDLARVGNNLTYTSADSPTKKPKNTKDNKTGKGSRPILVFNLYVWKVIKAQFVDESDETYWKIVGIRQYNDGKWPFYDSFSGVLSNNSRRCRVSVAGEEIRQPL